MGVNRASRIELHIDEVVFTGVDGLLRAEGQRVGEAFQRELGRLLEDQPLSICEALELETLDGLGRMRPTRSPDRLGRELARVVHTGLTGLTAHEGRPPWDR
jgi:hypothetical protein